MSIICSSLKEFVLPSIQWTFERRNLVEVYIEQQIKNMPTKDKINNLIISGYSDRPTGLGQACRSHINLVKRMGFQPQIIHVSEILNNSESGGGMNQSPGGTWLLHCNAPEALATLHAVGSKVRKRHFVIGYWAWELASMPWLWRKAAPLFDEIWVPSQHIASALQNVPVRVRVVPHPVETHEWPKRSNGKPFTILTAADYRSSIERKNILAAIQIYKLAFADETQARLIVKIHGAPNASNALLKIRNSVAGRADIFIETEPLSAKKFRNLQMNTDLFLSPHRAEGFGLMMAEFLANGIPCVATAWSGNMDYMASLKPFLIPQRQVPVRDPTNIYRSRRGAHWAEPDVNSGARALRWVYDNPGDAQNWSALGREAILKSNKLAWEETFSSLSSFGIS